jgi:DNA-binding MarR family transcriptional regulator
MPLKAVKHQNLGISTGNEGVPADRQTDRQTDQQTDQQTENSSFGEALDILSSLDNLKKEVRNKFKKITDQEFLVFSTIYQFSEENGFVDYRTLSQKLNLTESSIRDYIGRLIKKGIPIEKNRINNKIIQLSISEKLKKIASLPAIFQLRSL